MESNMTEFPAKPDGCAIDEIDMPDGRIYRWYLPNNALLRYGAAILVCAWLCGWAWGWFTVTAELLFGKVHHEARLFFFGWLCLWTLGGIVAIGFVRRLLRAPLPETVLLGKRTFEYHAGSDEFAMLLNPMQTVRFPRSRVFRRWFNLSTILSDARRPFKIDKEQLGPVKLERIGDRHGLCFRVNQEEIEIGEYLRETDRVWLAAVIEAWKKN